MISESPNSEIGESKWPQPLSTGPLTQACCFARFFGYLLAHNAMVSSDFRTTWNFSHFSEQSPLPLGVDGFATDILMPYQPPDNGARND